jgi:hypothetical protein
MVPIQRSGIARVLFSFALLMTMIRSEAVQKLINIDYGAHLNPVFSTKIGPAAAGISPADYWNLYSRDGNGGYLVNGTLNNLSWSDKTSSGANLQVQNAPGAWYTLNPDPMFQSYLYPNQSESITSFLTQLPGGSFDLYVYAHGTRLAGVRIANLFYSGISLSPREGALRCGASRERQI